MAFNGYLVRVGSYQIPLSVIKMDSYSAKGQQRQDLDSYRDSSGVLHRAVVGNRPPLISFQLIPMSETKLRPIINKIQENYINEDERKVNVNFFDPESGSYLSHTCYMTDIEFPINRIQSSDVYYDEITLEFIGY